MDTIPHRYPFLFVDGILNCDENGYVVGFKNVTLNEPYVYATSRDNPRLPESLVTECMAQVGAAAILSLPENAGKIMLFAALENLRFHRRVHPGEQLVSRVKPLFTKGKLGKMQARSSVSDELVAEGEFTYALADSGSLT